MKRSRNVNLAPEKKLKSILKKEENVIKDYDDIVKEEDELIQERNERIQRIVLKHKSTTSKHAVTIEAEPDSKTTDTSEVQPDSKTTDTSEVQPDSNPIADSIPSEIKKSKDIDDDDFNMFEDSVSEIPTETKTRIIINNKIENCDEEGYYKTIIGEKIHDYVISSQLGKGVFSTVFKATKDNQIYAIKIQRNNEIIKKAGEKEIKILKQLNQDENNHIVQLVDSFYYKNHLLLVFECLKQNTRELLKKNTLSLATVKSFTFQLFLGLSALQKQQIIHSDIKPDNIVVSESLSTIKICDFGTAFYTYEPEITPYLVSRFYRAPEIILGVKPDHPIDVWSVGCTIYEYYTGKILFPGKTNNQMLKLMMEYFGKKGMKKGMFFPNHFTEDFDFKHHYIDKITKKVRNINLELRKDHENISRKGVGCR
ncbi:Serine/threonine-protein kinase PRP4 [Boothiomyces sp. JEL0866]|nr:Serine/threonine-protein kinase PRP4 [Boothiomyces sp. JEL0866]